MVYQIAIVAGLIITKGFIDQYYLKILFLQSDLIDSIPPPRRWEIPRTPVTRHAVTHQKTASVATMAEIKHSSVCDESVEGPQEQVVPPQGGQPCVTMPASKELCQPSPPITVSKGHSLVL